MKKLYWLFGVGYFYIIGYIFLSKISEKIYLNSIEPNLENILKASVFVIATFLLEIGNHIKLLTMSSIVIPIVALFIWDKIVKLLSPIQRRAISLSACFILFSLALYLPLVISLKAEEIHKLGLNHTLLHRAPFFYNLYEESGSSDILVKTVVPGNITPCELKWKNGSAFINVPSLVHLKARFINFKDNYVQIAYYTDIDLYDMPKSKPHELYPKNAFFLNMSDIVHPNGYCLYTGGNMHYFKNMKVLKTREVFLPHPNRTVNYASSLVTIKKDDLISAIPGGFNFSSSAYKPNK